MVDFIDEVNEDLRQQRFNRFWQKVGGYVIAVSAVIIIATVGTVLWQNYREERQKAAAEAFLAADKTARAQRFDLASEEFSAVAERHAQGFSEMAQLKRAYALTRADKNDQALNVYIAITKDSGADKGVRSLARIYAATLMLDADKSADDINAVIKPLIGDASNPFSSFARELQAHVALKNGDAAAAHTILAALSADMQVPNSLRRRAQAQLATIGEQMEGEAEQESMAEDAQDDAAQ